MEGDDLTRADPPIDHPTALLTGHHPLREEREIVRALQNADVRDRLRSSGIDIIGNTPQEYAAMIKADIAAKRVLLKQIDMLHQ